MKALEQHLKPLELLLNADGVTEICVNQPFEIFYERNHKFTKQHASQLDYKFLTALSSLIAEFNHKDAASPLLSGSLPGGERVQIIKYPACEAGKIIFSIRRQQIKNMSLQDFQSQGAFWQIEDENFKKKKMTTVDVGFYMRDLPSFIKTAIASRMNILISGGTGTGKTTFLNACLKLIPLNERLITIEDTREVTSNHANAVNLLFNEDEPKISALNIFKSCLRLRPDRILLSELRGNEVWPFLRAANSGHPGSISTIHADSPEGAMMQLMFMMQQAGSTSTEEQILKYIKSIIHIVIQLKRDPSKERFFYVSDIHFNKL